MNSYVLRKIADVIELWEMGQYTYDEATQNIQDILESIGIENTDEVMEVIWG